MIDTSGISTTQPVYLPDPVNRQHPLNQGRVGWWLSLPGLDGGQFIYDLMGLNPGTLNNMTTSASGWRGTTRPGGFGHLLLDGTDDYVALPNSSALDFGTGDFSIGFWFRADSMASVDGYVFSHQKATTGFNGVGIYVRASSNAPNPNKLQVETSDGTLVTTTGTVAVNDGIWRHGIITRVGATCSIYVNGVLDTSGTCRSGSLSQSVAGNLGRFDGSGNPWKGALDDISIWNRALSPAEVKADYDLSRQGYPGVLNRISPRIIAQISGITPTSFSGISRSFARAAGLVIGAGVISAASHSASASQINTQFYQALQASQQQSITLSTTSGISRSTSRTSGAIVGLAPFSATSRSASSAGGTVFGIGITTATSRSSNRSTTSIIGSGVIAAASRSASSSNIAAKGISLLSGRSASASPSTAQWLIPGAVAGQSRSTSRTTASVLAAGIASVTSRSASTPAALVYAIGVTGGSARSIAQGMAQWLIPGSVSGQSRSASQARASIFAMGIAAGASHSTSITTIQPIAIGFGSGRSTSAFAASANLSSLIPGSISGLSRSISNTVVSVVGLGRVLAQAEVAAKASGSIVGVTLMVGSSRQAHRASATWYSAPTGLIRQRRTSGFRTGSRGVG